jgi:hypothetical protein
MVESPFILTFEARLLTETLSSPEEITTITASDFVKEDLGSTRRVQIRYK